MLFVLVICKPPYVLWFTILKYRELIVNFFICIVYDLTKKYIRWGINSHLIY